MRVALAVALDAPKPLRDRVDLHPVVRVRVHVRAQAGAGAGVETGAGTGAGDRVGAGDEVRAGVGAGGNRSRSTYKARWAAKIHLGLGGLLRNRLNVLTEYPLVYSDD